MHQGEALRLARDCAEDYGLAGVLSMAHEYDLKSGNTFCELAGLVLQALERGKLMEASNG